MSENSLKWIPLGGMELSAANLAAAEKLRKFGFSLMFSEFGSEKLTKAGLCIYDVLAEKEKPNILLITSTSELYGWYRILMTGIGADFKIFSGASNAITFFSENCPNLCLMSSEALAKQSGIKAKADKDFVWDLIVIDEEQSSKVPDYAFYKEQIPWKAEKLLITAPFPAKKGENKEALADLIKSVLADPALAAEADSLMFNSDMSKLDADIPAMRYFDQRVYNGSMKRNILFREYEMDEAKLTGLRRRMDLRSGLPVYKYGGNVFEDYDCEMYRATYFKASYTRSDVEELRAFDKKLDSFICLMDDIMAEGKRSIVYCCDKNTIDFLRKVISCLYGKNVVKVAKGELFTKGDILRKLNVDDSTVYPAVVLGVDSLGAVGDALDRIDYIINYELPTSAALLERRMTRHGTKNEAERKFIIFSDKNKLFDARVLDKALYGSIVSGFCGALPTRNILLDIDSKGDHLCNVFDDLKYVVSYANEVDNCFDLIKKFKGDYTGYNTEKISSAKQLAEFADKLLTRICNAFGLTKDSTHDDIKAAIDALSGLCVINDGRLEKVSDAELSAMSASFNDESWKQLPFATEAVNGVADAKKHIDELHSGENFHLNIKTELSELGDSIQYPVLFGIWRYRVREQDSTRSFREYIKIHNEGI
ncbi:MAG: hypothetical protein IJZ95_06745 [Oscillospiraceae bacterium]|nr:hypothetical protein [Oscillospiraceae bacterium]